MSIDSEVMDVSGLLLIAQVVLLLGNIVVFGLSLKIYTELMKDRNMAARSKQ